MKVENLSLNQFTAFDDEVSFNFSPGLNVLIGANGTGKTHVLKAAYTILKIHGTAYAKNMPYIKAPVIINKLMGVFKPDTVGHLVRKKRGNDNGTIKLGYANKKFELNIKTNGQFGLTVHIPPTSNLFTPPPTPAIYLPPHEFLSIYPGFIAAYQTRESAFDETYYDLSIALNALPLRGPKLAEVKGLIAPLEKAITAKVSQENGRFYLKLPEGKLESHLVSEGYRKLAGLIYLINNGSLTKNSILFWDEPAANLNPKLVTIVVKALRILAQAGLQIFIATHDYLLSQELSLLAEYPSATDIKFFALHRPNKKSGVLVESGTSLVDIENNPILAEFAAHYDREVQLFQQTQAKDKAK